MSALFFKSLSREKSTQDEKVRFIKRNELKENQVELHSFFIFKSENELEKIYFVISKLNPFKMFDKHHAVAKITPKNYLDSE